MLRVGVISDTHGALPPSVREALAECNHIIHAGDIGSPGILYQLEEISPVTAVLGNCDYDSDFENYFDDAGQNLKYSAKIVLEGVRILVMHRPDALRAALAGQKPNVLSPHDPLPHIAIHGHTHTPRREQTGAVLTLCPGSPSRPRGSMPSVLLLTLDSGKILSLEFLEV